MRAMPNRGKCLQAVKIAAASSLCFFTADDLCTDFMFIKMLLTAMLVISMTTAVGAIYKWLDEKGRSQFSDKHPAEGQVESLSIE